VFGTNLVVRAEMVPTEGVAGYQLLRDGQQVAFSNTPLFVEEGRARVPGSVTYSMRAVSGFGVFGNTASVSFTVTRPAAPKLVGAARSGTKAKLTVKFAAKPAKGAYWQVLRGSTVVAMVPATRTSTTVALVRGWNRFSVQLVTPSGVSGVSNVRSVRR
jgi:hypothetical protein